MSAAEVAVLASAATLAGADGGAADGAVLAALDGLEPELLQAATMTAMAARETMTRDLILPTDCLLLPML